MTRIFASVAATFVILFATAAIVSADVERQAQASNAAMTVATADATTLAR